MSANARVGVDCTGPVTVAVLRDRDGRVEPVLFDGTPHLPSGAFVSAEGILLTGTLAVDAQASAPQRVMAVPLRLLSESATTGSAGVDASPEDLVAALLRHVRDAAAHAAGGEVSDAVLVVPPAWGPRRRTRLRQAAYRGRVDQDGAGRRRDRDHRPSGGVQATVAAARATDRGVPAAG